MVQDLILPKMGESITEATVLKWLVREGDMITQDQPILEIATDKVDSEITAPFSGIVTKIFFQENEVAPIGSLLAHISDAQAVASADNLTDDNQSESTVNMNNDEDLALPREVLEDLHQVPFVPSDEIITDYTDDIPAERNDQNRFYSPLVRTIAKEEKIAEKELLNIKGTGAEGRVTKNDILHYVEHKNRIVDISTPVVSSKVLPEPAAISNDYDIIEMDRMRRLIADHMVMSKHTSPHVTSFIDVDVTAMVQWRNTVKSEFQKKYNQNITFTPLFFDLVVKAIKEYPLINSSVNGYQILQKKNINIGMATALSSGNLIVPVVKNADRLNLQGLILAVNDLATRARENKLKPDEITDGTFTITNLGAFQNTTGTPILFQPQVAILALGTIQKKPVVIETPLGDVIAIRHMMILSMSYDHRVVDGSLGGLFLKKMKELIESFDSNTII